MKRLLLVALLSFLPITLPAQVSSAELSGTVFDAAGAILPEAKIRATNLGTNVSHDSLSDATGNYVIPLLPPLRSRRQASRN